MSLKTCSASVLLVVTTLVGFFFQDLVSVDVEISQVKRFDTKMNCYQDDSRHYLSAITQFSVVSVRLFSFKILNIFHIVWFGELTLVEEETWISFD